MESFFCDTERMEQQKARSRQRNGLGRLGSRLDREDAMNLLVDVCRMQMKQRCRPVVIECLWACSEQALGSSILTICASVLSGPESSANGYR